MKFQNLNIKALKENNGYIEIAGLLIQWGTATANASITTNKFPVPFKQKCFSMAVTGILPDGGNFWQTPAMVRAINEREYTSGVHSGSPSLKLSWIAIGI